jgi:hypothetical protein
MSRKMPGSSHERTSGGEGTRAVAATSILCLHGYHGRSIIEHGGGHVIPASPEIVSLVVGFLQRQSTVDA